MENVYRIYTTFIASPGDVENERNIAEQVIDDINQSIFDSLKSMLKIERWEKLPPEFSNESTIQERLNEIIKGCHFFILILNKKYGTVARGQKLSNTEREINTILEEIGSHEKKIFLTYFKERTKNDDLGPQEKKIDRLKKRLEDRDILYKKYLDDQDFRKKLTHDLYRLVLRIELSPFKKKALDKFWQFGKIDSQDIPEVTIIYPPVPRVLMAGDKKDFWNNRLAPNVFFEDYKALHKIKKDLRIVGIGKFNVFSNYSIPREIKYQNVIWVCMPRQPRGIKSLNKYKDKCRFEFHQRSGNTPGYLIWKTTTGKKITLKSPLKTYLELQREKMDTSNEWHQQLGNIVAKDFAVIGRFNNTEANEYAVGNQIKEYFIAGIRGLGTWGATWFIDRCYKIFNEYETDEEIQMLLEVTYLNEGISYVRNVSDESEDYFKNECSLSTIKNIIKDHFGEDHLQIQPLHN
jgi:hypothetical protein